MYRGALADATTAAYHAHALSAGDNIALAREFTPDTPENLGLLAHELVHVARAHEPRFIPPIAEEPSERADETETMAQPDEQSLFVEPTQDTFTVLEMRDEETLAEVTEMRVIERARGSLEPPVSSLAPHEIRLPRGARPTYLAHPATNQPVPLPVRSARASAEWGALPAPWEPLPAWLASTPDNATSDAAEAPSVRRAASDRTTPETSSSTIGDAPTMERHAEPEPDLDALAQQVHALLKRRLTAERRREG